MQQAYSMIMKIVKILLLIVTVILKLQVERGIGQLTLSPMSVAPVCRDGDSVELTCTASVTVQFIRWSVLQVNDQGTLEEVTTSVQINSLDDNQVTERVVNLSTFTFTRSSAQEASPLVSTLSIDSVSIGLNGTVVRCSDVDQNLMISASTTILQIIDIDQLQQYPLMVHVHNEGYSINNITVTVEWIQQIWAVYNSSVFPPAPLVFTGSSSVQLLLEYNTVYNLSIEMIVAHCGGYTKASFIALDYANCGYINLSTPASGNDSVPTVEALGDTVLPIKGATFTFRCPPGRTLVGPNSTTCMETGEWEPDPSEAVCIVACEYPLQNLSLSTGIGNSLDVQDYSVPAIAGTTISFNCSRPEEVLVGPNTVTCMDDGQWDPDPHQIQISCKGEEGSDIFRHLTIAGGLLGVLTVILLILVTVIGSVILVQKGSLWRRITKRKLMFNVELNEEHNNTVHGPQNEESIVYAVVGPFSSGQSRSLETFILDDDRVEYAQINYNIMAQNCTSDSVDEVKFNAEGSLNLDSLLIRLKDYKVTEKWHQFGEALGVEKEVLDRCLNYPPEQSMVEMLNYWLRSCNLEERNWRDVAKALRQIEHHQLAEEIETIDKTESDVALHQPELDPSVVNECPPPIPPKKIQCHDYPEDSKCCQNLT